MTCPGCCAGYRFTIAAASERGEGPASAPSGGARSPGTRVIATFREPDTQPNDSIFVGSYAPERHDRGGLRAPGPAQRVDDRRGDAVPGRLDDLARPRPPALLAPRHRRRRGACASSPPSGSLGRHALGRSAVRRHRRLVARDRHGAPRRLPRPQPRATPTSASSSDPADPTAPLTPGQLDPARLRRLRAGRDDGRVLHDRHGGGGLRHHRDHGRPPGLPGDGAGGGRRHDRRPPASGAWLPARPGRVAGERAAGPRGGGLPGRPPLRRAAAPAARGPGRWPPLRVPLAPAWRRVRVRALPPEPPPRRTLRRRPSLPRRRGAERGARSGAGRRPCLEGTCGTGRDRLALGTAWTEPLAAPRPPDILLTGGARTLLPRPLERMGTGPRAPDPPPPRGRRAAAPGEAGRTDPSRHLACPTRDQNPERGQT